MFVFIVFVVGNPLRIKTMLDIYIHAKLKTNNIFFHFVIVKFIKISDLNSPSSHFGGLSKEASLVTPYTLSLQAIYTPIKYFPLYAHVTSLKTCTKCKTNKNKR